MTMKNISQLAVLIGSLFIVAGGASLMTSIILLNWLVTAAGVIGIGIGFTMFCVGMGLHADYIYEWDEEDE